MLEGILPEKEDAEVSAEMPLDETFLNKMFTLHMERQEQLIDERLEGEYGIVVSSQIVWELVGYECKIKQIEIGIEDFGIYGKDEHIFVIEQVKNTVFAMYGEEVVVYE